ncbi:PF11294 family protein [Leptospira santarosai str. CBC1416]|uniref:PF11294 family protein n=1 Tax=Leptospira santarosai str. CBC1416 TaxID=1193059 RepID=M6VRS9_9LEPT|nr:PF11294 family protein [Leptospira santarosai str. CBC1416]
MIQTVDRKPTLNTQNFYKYLPALSSFTEIIEPSNYFTVPDDWNIIITDVVNSTDAIQNGNYKDVNIAGGITAMAVSNLMGDMDYPFLFGGDGMTLLLPDSVLSGVKDILFSIRESVKNNFGLKLRAGIVNVGELKRSGKELKLCKLKISEFYNQAILTGSALDMAESLIKNADTVNPYIIPLAHKPKIEPDFTGFTCRWQDIPSHRGETVSFIVKMNSSSVASDQELLKIVLDQVSVLLGNDSEIHPLKEEKIKVDLSGKYFRKEATVHSGNRNGIFHFLKMLKIKIEGITVNLAINTQWKFGPKVNGMELRELRKSQVIASDFRKYDGTLKMVIACDSDSRELFLKFLDDLYQQGKLFYGYHVSDRALMTCALHEGSVREVHFVDSADGGYALAAIRLKEQIKPSRN